MFIFLFKKFNKIEHIVDLMSDLIEQRRKALTAGYINKKEAMKITLCSRGTIDNAFKAIRDGIIRSGKKPLSREVRTQDLFNVLGFQKGVEY